VESPDSVALVRRLEDIQRLTDELLHAQGNSKQHRELAERISREIAAARAALNLAR